MLELVDEGLGHGDRVGRPGRRDGAEGGRGGRADQVGTRYAERDDDRARRPRSARRPSDGGGPAPPRRPGCAGASAGARRPACRWPSAACSGPGTGRRSRAAPPRPARRRRPGSAGSRPVRYRPAGAVVGYEVRAGPPRNWSPAVRRSPSQRSRTHADWPATPGRPRPGSRTRPSRTGTSISNGTPPGPPRRGRQAGEVTEIRRPTPGRGGSGSRAPSCLGAAGRAAGARQRDPRPAARPAAGTRRGRRPSPRPRIGAAGGVGDDVQQHQVLAELRVAQLPDRSRAAGPPASAGMRPRAAGGW